MAEAGDPDWLDLLAIPDDDSWIWAWYAKTGNADNSRAWGTVRVPCLILLVRTTRSCRRANRSMVPSASSKHTATPTVTVRVFPGADHTLRIPPADSDGWPHNAAGFPAILAAFAQHPERSRADF